MQALHGSNVSDTTPGGYNPSAAPHRHRRSSSHSNSFSSASIVTLKRPGTQSPSETSLIALRVGRESVSHDHSRRKSVAVDSSERPAGDGLGAMNRMSHSTTSSVASISNPNTRRSRASSGAVLPAPTNANFSSPKRNWPPIDHSPRPSPHKRKTSSRPSSRRGHSPTSSPERERRRLSKPEITSSLTALPPLQPTPALTDPNDTESPSTIPTIGTPHSSYGQDYFGEDSNSPRPNAKSKKLVMAKNHMTSMSGGGSARAITSDIAQERISEDSHGEMVASGPVPTNESRAVEERPGSSTQPPAGEERRHSRRVRTHERGEKDKKQMLSRALQKANTAVLLDNAQNFEGALEAYSDACRLLQLVMDRSNGADDRRKLDSIRITYTNRMEELRQLAPVQPEVSEEKSLPARPMSDESLGLSPISPVSPTIDSHLREPGPSGPSTSQANDRPKDSYPKSDHDSLLFDSAKIQQSPTRDLPSQIQADQEQAIAEEDNASHAQFDFGDSVTNSSFDRQVNPQPLVESKAPVLLSPLRTDKLHLPLPDSNFVPAPLSPRRLPSPNLTPDTEQPRQDETNKVEQTFLATSTPLSDEDDPAPSSWLNMIEESTSSRASSVHSLSSEQGLRRKFLRSDSQYYNPELDAAFDAAVEAAYDQGLEPDLESRQKRDSLARGHTQSGSIAVRSSEIKEISPPISQHQPNSSFPLALDDEEEEAILDYITQDYASGFNFDLSTKSALPRQSDSSGYSRSTWQSSQVSDRTTAGTSLSTVAEDVQPLPASKNAFAASTSLNTILAEPPPPPPLAPPPQTSLPKLPNAAQNTNSSVRNRRLSGQNPKQLKIQTTNEPEQRKRASTIHSGSPGREDAPESALDKSFQFGVKHDPNVAEKQQDSLLRSPPSLDLRSALSDTSRPMTATTVTTDQRNSIDDEATELIIHRPPIKKNKSSASLREHMVLLASPTTENGPSIMTPMSTTFMSFAAKQRNDTTLTTQRANLPSFGPMATDSLYSGGVYLFDTSLSSGQMPTSPRSPVPNQPGGLEPCPESFLLRPFWLMRSIASTLTHAKGGFLTTRLFVPREVWLTRGVKLKSVEDKIANCDLLTAALGRLAGVDTYDADAVMEELQNFEEVMERVQSALVKRIGSDVGISGLAGVFKDAATGPMAGSAAHGAETTIGAEKTRSKESKGYLNSWRKLRSKSSGTPIASSQTNKTANKTAEKELPTMDSVPMTSYVPVERRGHKKDVRNLMFEGPNREYMGSLARLFEGAQILGESHSRVFPDHRDLDRLFIQIK